MKKILVGYITNKLGAGINQYIINFINKISSEDVQIDLLTCEDKSSDKYIKENILSNVKYNNLYYIPRNKHVFSSVRQLKKIISKEHYDITYFNISSAHDCLGVITAKMCAVKKIITHSHNSSVSGGTKVKRLFKGIFNFFGKYIIANCANTYLACSKKAAKWLYPSYIYNSNNYTFINNTIDINKYKFDKSKRTKIRKQLGLTNELLIGHIARFDLAQKNNYFAIDILEETLKQNKNAKLICIGGGKDFDKVKEYAENKKLSEHIIYTGRINNAEDYYNAIDVFILPSKFEGLPITGVEAQFADLPCLFSDRITDEVIISKNSKLLPIDSAKIWADEIITLDGTRKNELLECSNNFDNNSNKQADEILDINKTNKNNKYNIELLLSLLFMLEGFFQACNFTFGKRIISFVLWPMVFLGILILIYRLVMIKNYKFGFRNILLLLFDLSLIIPSLIFKKYRLYLNIKFMILMLFQFCILYFYKNKYDEKKKFNISILTNIFISLSLLLVLGSFYVLLIKYNYVINTAADPIVYGISAGRLYGIFWDPNIGSLISTIAFIMSLHKISISKKVIIKFINIILCLLFALYNSLSDSRMSALCLIIGVVFYTLLILISKNNLKKSIKIIVIFIALLSIFVTLNGKKTYNTVIENLNKKEEIKIIKSNKSNNKKKKENIEKKYVEIERGYDLKSDISNRRIDIWKSGIEIVKQQPVFGIGHANVLPYVRDELPDSYLINNTQKDFSSMHNMFMDTVVSQGIVGLVLYLMFVISTIFLILKNFKYLINMQIDNILYLTIILIEFISSMVITEIIYIDSPMSVIFWICLGQLMNYIDFKKKEA